MTGEEIINGIFDELIQDAEEDCQTTTLLKYLEAKRQEWLTKLEEVD